MLGLEAAELLMECVANTDGDYIEIGAAFGGSAILAAKAMSERPGTVYCIDNFLGVNMLESMDAVWVAFWRNIISHGVEQRVVAFNQSHPPFPDPIHFHEFSVGLIDGDHLGEGPLKDFLSLDSRVTDYLLFDNSDQEPIEITVQAAIKGGDWEEYKTIEYHTSLPSKAAVGFTVLKKIQNSAPRSYYEKVVYYMGDSRIPL